MIVRVNAFNHFLLWPTHGVVELTQVVLEKAVKWMLLSKLLLISAKNSR